MKRIFLKSIAYLCLCLLCSLPVFSKTASPPSNDDFEALTLNLQAKTNEVILLEPISLLISLENNTPTPIVAHTALEFWSEHIKLVVTHDGITQQIEDLSYKHVLATNKPTVIKPNEKYSVTEQLNIDLDKYFPKASSYTIQVLFYDIKKQQHISSNKVTVVVKQPVGLDIQAFKYIQNTTNTSSFLSFIIGNQEEQTLREFTQKYKNSTYEKYASFMLGKFYFKTRNYVEAVTYLKPIIRKKSFVAFEETLSYITQAYIKLGQKEEAKLYIKLLENNYPASEELEKCRDEMILLEEQHQTK